MHRVAVKSKLVDSRSELTNKLRYEGGDEAPVCPKPRRLGPAPLPDFLKLHNNCTKHSQMSTDGRSEILNIIAGKSADTQDSGGCKCSPLCYSGSPPSRSDNPLVHDVEFIHQMELLSPLTRTKLSDRFIGFTSSASPT